MSALPNQIMINPDILDQELDDESILLNLNNENYHGLDDVGTRIWQLLKHDSDVENLVTTMVSEYDVDETVLRQDLATLIEQLSDQDLITVT